ncbi:hypothetical protein GCM10009718_09450 [Isoptericola halotolerans]
MVAVVGCLAALAPSALTRSVYSSPDGDGMVVLARWRPALEIALAVLVLVPFAALFGFLGSLVFPDGGVLAVVLSAYAPVVWVLVGGAVISVSGSAVGVSPVGDETPRGRRWQLAALAQRPGTRLSAVLLARRLVEDLPAGDVVVAAAGDDALLDAYVRAGFTPGEGRRVYRTV